MGKELLMSVVIMALIACKKEQFKESNIFEADSGIELFLIDSARTTTVAGGPLVTIFFHISPQAEGNYEYISFFKLRRDGNSLNSFLKKKSGYIYDYNSNLQPGHTYNYQFSMYDINNSESKRSKEIPITIP